MKLLACILLQIIVTVGLLSCKKDEPCLTCPPPNVQHIFLDTLIIDPTEVWLRVYTNDSSTAGAIEVYRDSGAILLKTIVGVDTTIIDSGLTPMSTHSYKAYRLQGGLRIDSTRVMRLRTMDTTNHNFTWQIDTLGDGGPSILRDVSAINDTSVWVVGELHYKDSSGNLQAEPFNAAHWDGNKWTPLRIYYVYQGQNFYSALYAVFSFGPSDVWVGSNQPEHWNGNTWEQYDVQGTVFTGYISKIWGTSSSNLYIVGKSGAIAHFDGSTWTRMDSGTDVDLLDVWGSPDGSVVWACGYYYNKPGTYLLRYSTQTSRWEIRYDGTSSEFSIRPDSLSGAYTGVYTPTKNRIYVGSSAGVYAAPATTQGQAKRLSFTSTYFPGFPRGLRGNASNDLTIAGAYTMIAHYNGMSWRYFSELRRPDEHFNALSQTRNLIVAVGIIPDPINSRAIAFIGRR